MGSNGEGLELEWGGISMGWEVLSGRGGIRMEWDKDGVESGLGGIRMGWHQDWWDQDGRDQEGLDQGRVV